MSNLNKIIAKLEVLAPLALAEDWDNTGWQVYLGNEDVKKVMLALSPTLDVVEQAISNGCELLITHHPLIFSGIKTLSVGKNTDLAVIKAIQGGMQVYAAHTNLDSTEGGIADVLVEKLGLRETSPLAGNLGRRGKIEARLDELISRIKKELNTDNLKLINPSGVKEVKNVAVMPGSGGSLIPALEGIDLYITGDVKYHDALEVKNFAVIDAGHFETERIIIPTLEKLLQDLGAEIFTAEESLPWEIV